MKLRQSRNRHSQYLYYGKSSLHGSGTHRKRISIFRTENQGSVLRKHIESSPTPRPNLEGSDQNCIPAVFNQLRRLHRASSLQGSPSTTIAALCLTREHCRGTGYITTALGQLPCFIRGKPEFTTTGQHFPSRHTKGNGSALLLQTHSVRKILGKVTMVANQPTPSCSAARRATAVLPKWPFITTLPTFIPMRLSAEVNSTTQENAVSSPFNTVQVKW